jgi:hypothetical protein
MNVDVIFPTADTVFQYTSDATSGCTLESIYAHSGLIQLDAMERVAHDAEIDGLVPLGLNADEIEIDPSHSLFNQLLKMKFVKFVERCSEQRVYIVWCHEDTRIFQNRQRGQPIERQPHSPAPVTAPVAVATVATSVPAFNFSTSTTTDIDSHLTRTGVVAGAGSGAGAGGSIPSYTFGFGFGGFGAAVASNVGTTVPLPTMFYQPPTTTLATTTAPASAPAPAPAPERDGRDGRDGDADASDYEEDASMARVRVGRGSGGHRERRTSRRVRDGQEDVEGQEKVSVFDLGFVTPPAPQGLLFTERELMLRGHENNNETIPVSVVKAQLMIVREIFDHYHEVTAVSRASRPMIREEVNPEWNEPYNYPLHAEFVFRPYVIYF